MNDPTPIDRLFERLAKVTAEGRLPEAPEDLVERALSIPAEHPRPESSAAPSWSLARLIRDALGRPALAGVRGGFAVPTRRLYDVDGGHLDMEIAPDPEDPERARVRGQLLFDDRPPPEDLVVALWRDATVVSGGAGDATGTFTLRGVASGRYRLEILAPSAERAIRLSGLHIGTDAEE